MTFEKFRTHKTLYFLEYTINFKLYYRKWEVQNKLQETLSKYTWFLVLVTKTI